MGDPSGEFFGIGKDERFDEDEPGVAVFRDLLEQCCIFPDVLGHHLRLLGGTAVCIHQQADIIDPHLDRDDVWLQVDAVPLYILEDPGDSKTIHTFADDLEIF